MTFVDLRFLWWLVAIPTQMERSCLSLRSSETRSHNNGFFSLTPTHSAVLQHRCVPKASHHLLVVSRGVRVVWEGLKLVLYWVECTRVGARSRSEGQCACVAAAWHSPASAPTLKSNNSILSQTSRFIDVTHCMICISPGDIKELYISTWS